MSSPPRKSAFRAPPSRVTGERNSPASPMERVPKKSASSASGPPRRVSGGSKGTLQTGEVLKRRLERLKQNSNSQTQNGVKPKSGSTSVQSPTGDRGRRNGASSNNNRVDSPDSTPTPLNTSTPLFVRRMSENDPRRNLIKSSITGKRKASLPAQSSRSSFSIGPSPLAATDTKPKRTMKHPNSEAYGSISQSSTPRGKSIHEQANATSTKTRPTSSSPRTSIGLSSRDRTSRTTPCDSDLSRTSTPDQMIRVIHVSQESLNEAHMPMNPKESLAPGQGPSQREDLSRGHPGGEGSSRDRKTSENIQDDVRGSKGDPKLSYVSNSYDEDNNTNVELELKSLKSESDSSVVSERTQRKRNIKASTSNEKRSEGKSSGGLSKKSPQMQEQDEHDHVPVAVKEELVHQHASLEDSSPRHENNLEVIDLEIRRDVKVENEGDSRRNLEVVSDNKKKWSSRSQGTDEERMSDGIDQEVMGDRQRRGSGFKGELEGQRRRSRTSGTSLEAEKRGHRAKATKVRDEEKGKQGESSNVIGHSPRLKSVSRSKSQDTDDEADKLARSIDGREDTSPRNKVATPSPRREEPATDKRQMIRQRSTELAVMAKRLEEKAKEMKNRPTTQWKRTASGTDNAPILPKSTTPLSPTANTTTTTTTGLQELPRPATSTGMVPDIEQMKRMMVKQRARELAESAQKALVRDREMENLKQELEALKKTLDIGKQDQLIEGDLQRTLSTGSSTLKLKALEDSNSALKDELQKLQEDSRSSTQKLEVEVSQQRKTCEALERDLCEERQKSNQLALDLQQAVNQNAFLTKQLGDLHRKLSLLDQVLEECRQLREDFSEQRQILHSTIAERDWLRDSVIKLNSDIALMQASEEKRKQLERDYEEALRDLELRQSEIRRLQMAQDEVMTQNRDVVSRLEHKVQNLEKQWIETRQNSGRNAAELSGLRQQTHSQLQNLASTSPRATSGQNPGPARGSTTVKSKEAEKEDWKKIAEEALVTRAPSQVTASAPGPKPKSQDAADLSQGSESSQRSAAKIGQVDSISEPGDLLDELSDKIDQVLLNKLHHASVSSGPISKLAVFIARYNYDPSLDSPNDNYDSELPLTAGDYIYVYGDPDEDGFYEGELMDGRRGLVPSNFIERIAEENLPDFMQYNGSQGDEDPLSDLDFNSEDADARRSNMNHFSAGDLGFARAQSDHPSDLEDIPEVDEDDDNHHSHAAARRSDDASLASFSDFSSDVSYVVPCPRKLTLERQLKYSVIMCWVAPDTVTLQEIQEFRVYVDGQYRTATKQGAKSRALVENVDATGTYRISVRTVTAKGMSEEAACMLVIGRDASVAPTNLKASNVGPSSANISWLPGNSNLPHVISVNGEEVRTVKPGIYKYSLSDLQPLSVYRINVRAKSRRQTAVADNPQASKNSIEIEFKTLPGGLPDAPLDVQVRQATNDTMVSVEWLPVTITTSSLSNGAVIMGYAVFVNNNKVAETMSPTADRVNIPKSKLRMLSAQELVVRTLSPNGSSNDSLPAKVPPGLLEEQRKDKMAGKVAPGGKRRKKVTFDDEDPVVKAAMYADVDDEDSSSTSRSVGGRRSSDEDSLQKVSQKGALKADGSPREDALPLKPIMKTEKPGILRESDYMSDSDRSELSDIQEEVEEELSEFGSTSLPGLSDSSEGMRSSSRRRMKGDDEKKKVQESLQVLQYNTKPPLDFDTDPEVESLNKPDKVVPIPIIRSQRDYERETEQSPHNPVVEPVPWKPAKKVPQIEITKDANNEHLKAASRKTDLYNPEKRTEVIRTSPVSSASNSLPMASPRSDPRGQSRTQGQRSNSQWNASSVASSSSEAASYGKNYDAKSNNDRHHHQADGRPHSESSSHRRSDSSGHSDRNRHSRHSDSLQTPDSSLSLQRSSRGSRSEETFGEDDDEEGFSGSEPEELFDDGTIRHFIAIFDYNPAIMSPNIDGAEEELFLKEGDVLKIIGDKDADGFFVGEMNGRRGYVPCNMVEEIESPEQTPLANASKRGDSSQGHDRSRFNDSLNTTGSSHVNMYDGLSSNGQLVIPRDSTPHHMRALFDYNPQELSPNPDLDMELSFRQGDSLIVYGEMDEDGFFMGELRGKRGLVPSNFLEEVSDIDSSTTSRSYSPSFNRNKENKHQTQQSTKDKHSSKHCTQSQPSSRRTAKRSTTGVR